MIKIAHLSDPHLGPLPDPKLIQLFSKRILGYLNWRRNRAKSMGGSYLNRLVEDMKSQSPDHIAITGDLVNIALPLEITGAKVWLDGIGSPDQVTVVPGNHDAYVPGALKRAIRAWYPYMCAQPPEEPGPWPDAQFPFVRKRGKVAFVGVSTARASGPWFATGRVGSRQSRLLRQTLDDLRGEGLFRVVMLHHPPFPKATGWHKRLSDASRVRTVIKRAGAELILHGHTHIDSFQHIDGRDGPVPVIGVPSATTAPGGKKPAGRYNIFEIEPEQNAWSVSMLERGLTANGDVADIATNRFRVPRPAD